MLRRLFTTVLFLSVACVSFWAKAQTTATLTGVVTDPTGAVIPNVTVEITNPSTGISFKAVTNSAGSYRIANIPPGPGYQLVFTSQGFSPYRVDNVYVNVASTGTQNAQLTPGQQVEITVNAGEGATLNTEDASIGNNVQVSKLNELPVQNRLSPTALLTLEPGITLTGATTGARVDQNNITVDGLDVNDFGTGNFGSIVANAPVDSVQEFRGTVGGYTANSGPSGGGQFQLVTKSGSNQWHGQANLYHRDNSTTANDWFNDLAGLRAPKLVQNQFGGSLGGPIKHDKAFFFFDYYNSRIARAAATLRTVPLASYLAGNVSYINNNPGCTYSSRQNTTPNCISSLTPAQVQALDPAGIGESPALFSLLKSRYPAVNDPTAGDGINTGGYRFNAPEPQYITSYVGKINYNLTSRINLWGRGTVSRENQVNSVAQFPGLPPAAQFVDRSYAYVVGMDWQISPNKVNQFTYGATVQDWSFPRPQNPLGINQIGFSSGVTTLLDSPYSSPSNSQSRHIPIPQIQDNLSWNLGRHSLSIGGTYKWITETSNTVLDYNSYTIGLGGEVQGLDASMRPANLLRPSSTAQVTYDSAFTAALGRVGSVATTVNYDAAGNPLPQGTGARQNYKYYQTLVYVSDSWKITPHFTLTYGLNYQYFSVPYETNGLETVQTMGFDKYMSARVAQSAAGISGPGVIPFITYVLGGPKNHGPALYNRDPKNFGPRVAFAWNPKFDEKSVFSGGFGIVYDRTIVSAVQYQQVQYSYLFQQNFTQNYGNGTDPRNSVRTDPRYDAPPAAPVPATPRPPFQPYVDATGAPYGLQNGGAFNETVDPNLKTPYSMTLSFNFQHQFPGSTLMRIGYAGRLGRRLLAQADANQLVEFPDKASGQLMSQAMGNVTKELRAGADPTNLPAEPWFENQFAPGAGVANGYPNNTSYIASALQSLMFKGDFADTIQALSGGLGYNVGMGAQFSENTFYTNKGFSTYHGLLVSVQKNLTRGLQFDANYTWSHSIDNVSVIANSPALGGYGFVCDVLRPRACRGNSDFDTTHYLNGDFTYSLPFGRGRAFGGNIPWALNELIGGWDLSGLAYWHSGTAYSTVSSAFVAGYANNAPAIFNGDVGALQHKIHKTSGGQLFLYADPQAAVNAFQGPIGFEIGSRNSLRGPQYFDLDSGLAKTFALWPDRGLNLKFRADAFNVLNHPNFSSPGTNTNYDDITQASNFGQLTSMNGSPRVMQLSVRVEF
ncbi:MAG: carboxypeptidase regulatory-like domain-containing protein [Acidobacterium ailaaui]|nr:carboxypeptidase regulatory-like domain-containing protein [Pseudacidobacterium ailaaui]